MSKTTPRLPTKGRPAIKPRNPVARALLTSPAFRTVRGQPLKGRGSYRRNGKPRNNPDGTQAAQTDLHRHMALSR